MKKNLSLAELQHEMQRHIQQNILTETLPALIKETPPLSIQDRVKIYQRAYRYGLMGSLEDDFNQDEQLLPQKKFQKLAWEFIKVYPSKAKNLADYSADFVDFIRDHHPQFYESVCLSWLQILVSKEVDNTQCIPIERITETSSFVIKTRATVKLCKINSVNYLVFKNPEGEVQITTLDDQKTQLLYSLQSGLNLAAIAQKAEQLNMSAEILAESLQHWLAITVLACEELP